MPDVFRCLRCEYSCAYSLPHSAHQAAGALGTRHSPRPLDFEGHDEPSPRGARRLRALTPIFYERPDLFRVCSVTGDEDCTRHRWTLDTPEDLQLIRAITLISPTRLLRMARVITLMEENPELAEINSHVIQKAVAS